MAPDAREGVLEGPVKPDLRASLSVRGRRGRVGEVMWKVDALVALHAALLDAHELDATLVEEVVHEQCAGRVGLPQSTQLPGLVRVQGLDVS